MPDKFYFKISEVNGETLLAVCDEEIAGETFEDDNARLTVSRYFYCGEICDEKKLAEKMKKATIINLAGSRCVDMAVKNGFVKKHGIIRIGLFQHAQVITAKYSAIE